MNPNFNIKCVFCVNLQMLRGPPPPLRGPPPPDPRGPPPRSEWDRPPGHHFRPPGKCICNFYNIVIWNVINSVINGN